MIDDAVYICHACGKRIYESELLDDYGDAVGACPYCLSGWVDEDCDADNVDEPECDEG